ncbi:Protein kinase domain-containing protein [Nannocystis exedens]|uniref:Protein kinase domain-containing protein n=1 Tax=Nannocystis exedens TaxID=54 RepID=A0A1I2B9L8_9BACT|nr:serine/threonine-protein kinase [Nannocystis exedens]PCC68107.1 protein kinase [Nannocystis exedens]SFE52831.1 Protein kinase domain-containing protein [Nannocystis exedens]
MESEAPSDVPALARHPDPAPSAAIRGARARLLARLDQLSQAGDDKEDDEARDDERYAIGEVFAVGGLGVVRRAHDRRLERVVAVKTLRRRDPEAARRFAAEARITARLQHPGIVPLYDIGRFADGEPYYCMKLVDGESLERVIADEPTLRGRVALVPHVLAAADAIAYAHQHGVLHRDIKPSNILVGPHGETVVIDWGLAKDTSATRTGELAGEGPDTTSDMTGEGAIVGTLRYMPPEQARGAAVDARSDVYALGAVLFHVLAGRPPHAQLERGQLLSRLIAGEVEDLRPLVPEAPRELVAIVRKAMSPEPGDRYAGAAALAEDLRRFAAGRLVDAHRYQPGELLRLWLRRHRVAVAAIGAATVAAAAASLVYLRRVEAARARAEAAEAEALRRANDAVLAQARGVLDEDPVEALRLLRRVELSDPLDLRRARLVAVAAVARGAPERVLRGHTRPIEQVAPLADGGLVSIDGGGAVWRWNLGTGRGEQVIDLRAPFGTVVAAAEAPVWAALAGSHGVIFRGDEAPESIDLSDLPIGVGLTSHRWELSRGGETLAALAGMMRLQWLDPAAAYAWDLTTRPARAFALPFRQFSRAVMSPDGSAIALTGAQRQALLVKGAEATPLPALTSPTTFSPSGLYLVEAGTALSLHNGTTRPLAGGTLTITHDDQALVRRRNPNHGPGTDDPQLALVDLATGQQRWERDLYRSSEEMRAFANNDGGFVAADTGDRFAVRHGRRWTLWSTAFGRIVRVLEVGRNERAAFAVDGRFVSTHDRDLWLWSAETGSDVPNDRWLTATTDSSHALVLGRDGRGAPEILRTRDGRRSRVMCPLRLDLTPTFGRSMRQAIDRHGRALIAGVRHGACLIDDDGRTRILAVDEPVGAVALAESGELYAVGLADGTVLASFGAGSPLRWRLDAGILGLWATPSGSDLIAHTSSDAVFGLHVGDGEPVLIGSVRAAWDGTPPVVAVEPQGSRVALVLPGTDTLVTYDEGAVTRRSLLLESAPQLAFSSSGELLAVSLAGRAVLVLAGPDDPGREFPLPEAIHRLEFVTEDELTIVGRDDSLIRLDLGLGEMIVLQHEHTVKSLGNGVMARIHGDGPPPLRAPADGGVSVPRDRSGLTRWLAARTE